MTMIRTAINAPPAKRSARPALPATVLPLRRAEPSVPARRATQPVSPFALHHRPEAVHSLQRSLGNAAVRHLLGEPRVQRAPGADLKTLKGQYDNTQDPRRQDQIKRQMEAVDLVRQRTPLLGPPADEISTSILEPYKINQGQFNFCGPNAFLMALAGQDPVGYVTYLLDLYAAKAAYSRGSTQKQTAQLGAQTVGVPQEVTAANITKFANRGGTAITKTDWMSMASLRGDTTEKAVVQLDPDVDAILKAFGPKGDVAAALHAAHGKSDKLEQAIMHLKQGFHQGGDTLTAMAQQKAPDPTQKLIAEGTMPSEVAKWFTGFGAVGVVQNADAFTPNKSAGDLTAANGLLDASLGKVVLLNVNAETIEHPQPNIAYAPLQSHWVLMKTPFVFAGGIYVCRVDTWGGTRDLKIYAADIQNTFFGYVAATIPARPTGFDPATIV
jgi:hypothetical protein